MCGRFTLKTPLGSWLRDLFQTDVYYSLLDTKPRFNIAPTQSIIIARMGASSDPSSIELSWAKWGLIPSWSNDAKIGSRMINARSETVEEKVSFRKPLQSQRCVVIADGYYEWMTKKDKSKQPFWIHREQELPFAMAGLWETNGKVQPGHTVITATIITTSSNERLGPIHDRMPVIFEDPSKTRDWLDTSRITSSVAASLCTPAHSDFLLVREVGPKVGSVKWDQPDCLNPVEQA